MKKAVKEDGMTWIQVLNNYDIEKVDLPKIYGIQGFPTKILLDKEGKIFFRILGNDPEKLDQKLKELIGEQQRAIKPDEQLYTQKGKT